MVTVSPGFAKPIVDPATETRFAPRLHLSRETMRQVRPPKAREYPRQNAVSAYLCAKCVLRLRQQQHRQNLGTKMPTTYTETTVLETDSFVESFNEDLPIDVELFDNINGSLGLQRASQVDTSDAIALNLTAGFTYTFVVVVNTAAADSAFTVGLGDQTGTAAGLDGSYEVTPRQPERPISTCHKPGAPPIIRSLSKTSLTPAFRPKATTISSAT